MVQRVTRSRISRGVAAGAVALAVVVGGGGAARAFDRGADGEFEKRVSSHFVLLQDVDIDETSGLRGSRRFEQNVLDVLEAAYDEADERLGLRPERPITVVVYDPQVFDASFAGRFRFPVAGFYGGRVHVRGDTVMTARLSRCLHHELVHAALDAELPPGALPAWLNEGVAEWFEARATGERRLSGRSARALGDLARRDALFSLADLSAPTFGHLGPEGAAVAYLQSRAFVDYLVALRGERALRDWIREIVRTGDVERATRRTFRGDPARLFTAHLAALADG